MTTLRNTSPVGAIDLPLIGQVVDAGATFEVSEEQAKVLLLQEDNFHRVPKRAPSQTTPTTDGDAGDDSSEEGPA